MTKVIVIDDDHDAVRSLSTLLEMKGVSVEGKGYDGKEAVDLYKDLRPDAVLLDMLMPEYDGKYAIKKIKNDDPDAKIIVLTAYKPNYEFEENEVAAVFDKPYKISEVIEEISKWFRKIETNTYIFLNFMVQLMRILGTKNLLMSLLIINKKTIPPSHALKSELLRYVVSYDLLDNP